MKSYVYKIQWLFPITASFVETEKVSRKKLFDVIKVIGAKSLTVIYFLDENYKRVASYSGFVGYPTGAENEPTIQQIKKELKLNPKIKFVELLRR